MTSHCGLHHMTPVNTFHYQLIIITLLQRRSESRFDVITTFFVTYCVFCVFTKPQWVKIVSCCYLQGEGTILAATKQLYKLYFPSVRLSVCLSVTPFWLCSHHCIIMKFSGVITNDESKVHAKGQGQRSKVKVTEVATQLNRFRTVTPVWIHIWWWSDDYIAWCCLEEVHYCFSR